MTPERWRTVEQIFHAASELAGNGRASYLDRACAGDAELRQEVEALLAEDQAAPVDIGLAIEQEAQELLQDESEAAWVGRRLGPWRITSLVGQGGMGAVYGALREDGEFELGVAIKVLRFPMASPAEAARFRQERRILARLEHPHIARLLDGGEIPVQPYGTNAPYIVMEHVEGVPITTYCHDHGLPTQERLKLFLQVLEAVGYAHHKLVLHRDLKPENVLVTPEGMVKLLDFGVAKMLEAGSAAGVETSTTLVPLTPEYASPEQIRGEPLSAATDVYSLGVILYELLGERRPYSFRKTDSLEVARVICEVEAPSLGLDDDLDALVAKAIEKEPARRYRSVEQFAEDIRRYLAGLPLLARKSSAGYRVRKFLRRNRVPVMLTALAIAGVAGGLVSSIHQARRAERRFNQVRQLANTFVFEVYDAIAKVPGATKARELVVGKALVYLERLEGEARGDPDLQFEWPRPTGRWPTSRVERRAQTWAIVRTLWPITSERSGCCGRLQRHARRWNRPIWSWLGW
ncbi:MAG: serine/threonine-protein kinase [Acidobacteriota bacterium]|mgnify:CR=1 FL=1